MVHGFIEWRKSKPTWYFIQKRSFFPCFFLYSTCFLAGVGTIHRIFMYIYISINFKFENIYSKKCLQEFWWDSSVCNRLQDGPCSKSRPGSISPPNTEPTPVFVIKSDHTGNKTGMLCFLYFLILLLSRGTHPLNACLSVYHEGLPPNLSTFFHAICTPNGFINLSWGRFYTATRGFYLCFCHTGQAMNVYKHVVFGEAHNEYVIRCSTR